MIEITHKDIIWEEAEHIEKYLISFWREVSKVGICNLTDGGEGVKNLKLSNDVIKKRNQSIKEAWSEERKNVYRIKFSGEKNPFYGKKHSDVTKKKMSENNNPRKKLTQEHKNRISNSNKGKKRTDENKAKLSELKKGKSTWNKGIECKKETREKLSKALKEYFKKKKNEVYNGG